MTPDQLRKIAEACGLTVAPTSRPDICEVWDDTTRKFFGSLGPKQGDGYSLFAPHLDANQAIACLDRRFMSWGSGHSDPCIPGHACTIRGTARRDMKQYSGQSGDSTGVGAFCAAAMNAILESLK